MTTIIRPLATALGAFLVIAPQAAAQLYQGPDTGSVASGVMVTTGAFAKATTAAYGGPAFREPRNKIRLLRWPDRTDARSNAPATAAVAVTDPSVGGAVRTAPPPIPVVSLEGMRDPGSFIPPDPYIAVGPRHVVAVDNGGFRIMDKQGRTLGTIAGDFWFSTTVKGAVTFDPKVVYDHFADRWIMVWLDQSDAERRSFFLVSVSDDDDPLGSWYNWALPGGSNGNSAGGNWADYQGVGFDQHALYITSNNWTFDGSYDYAKIRIIPKADLYANAGGRVRWTDLWDVRDAQGVTAYGIRPVIMYGTPAAYHFVTIPFTNGGSSITLFTLTDPLSAPSLTARRVPVAAWSNAPDANQPGGSSTPIEASGSNLSNEPVYRDNSIWLVHSVGNAGQFSSVRYLRISATGGTVEEDGSLGAPGYWYYYPAIAVDKNKNIAITYSRSGTSEYIGSYMSWRLASDPPGVLRPSVQLQPGKGSYVKSFGSGRNRWGDYLGIALDPASMEEFWMYSQYAADTDVWGNWVHNARLTPYPERSIQAEQRAYRFDLREAGTTSDTVTFRLYNVGATPLTVSSVSISSPAFRLVDVPALPRHLGTWDTLAVRAAFAPLQHGEEQDSIIISSDDPSKPAYGISITGKGVEVGTAQPGVVYAVGGVPTARLYGVDRQGGPPTDIGPTGVQSIKGLAVHPLSGEIHGSVQRLNGTDIVRISSVHGDALRLRTIPYNNIRGFVYTHPDTILAVGFTAGRPNGMVYRIGPGAHDTLTLSVNPSILMSGLARDPTTGAIWSSVTPALVNRDRVFSIDPVSGTPTLLGSTGIGQGIASLALDPGGTLYGLQVNGALIDIDRATGTGRLIGPTGVAGATAIALSPERPATDVGTGPADGTPTAFRLEQNFPNPFNPATEIRFQIGAMDSRGGQAASADTRLVVYDLVGREVAVLVDRRLAPGSYTASFDASRLASGVYLYRLSAGGFVHTRKMVLTR